MQATTSKPFTAANPKDSDHLILSTGPRLTSDCPHPFLDSVALLPNLNRIFYERSTDLIACEGHAAWHAQGGRVTTGKLLTFGNPSPIASQILSQLANQFAGFHYTDDVGTPWCVRWTDDQDQDADHWRAIAIGGGPLLFLLSRRMRDQSAAALRREFGRRHSFKDSRSTAAEECRRSVRSLVRRIRLYDGTPRMLPIICSPALANGTSEVEIAQHELADALFGPNRAGGPLTAGADVCDAISLLAGISLRVLRLPKTGWLPITSKETTAVTLLNWRHKTFRIGLAPEFLAFLEPCLRQDGAKQVIGPQPEFVRQQSSSGDHIMVANNTPTTAEPNPGPESASELQKPTELKLRPNTPADAKTQLLQEAIVRIRGEAQFVERGLPAAVLATISSKSTGKAVSADGFRVYLDRFLINSGGPVDSVERMLLEEMMFAHFRIGQLHSSAAGADKPELAIAYSLAAAKLTDENRKMSLTLAQYRTKVVAARGSGTPQKTITSENHELATITDSGTKNSTEENHDSELRTKQPGPNDARIPKPDEKADRRPAEPLEAQRINGFGATKAARFSVSETTVGALNGSTNGHG